MPRKMPRHLEPSPAQMQALAAYAMTGNHREAADLTGRRYYTHRKHIAVALARLGAVDCFEAFRIRGWLVVPAELLATLAAPRPPREMTA